MGEKTTEDTQLLKRQRGGKGRISTAFDTGVQYSHWRAERRAKDDFATKSPTQRHVRPRGGFWPDFAHILVRSSMAELTDVGGHAGGSGAREGSRLFPRHLGRLPRDSRLSLPGILLPGILLRGIHHEKRTRQCSPQDEAIPTAF